VCPRGDSNTRHAV